MNEIRTTEKVEKMTKKEDEQAFWILFQYTFIFSFIFSKLTETQYVSSNSFLDWNNNKFIFCLFGSNVHCPLFCFVKIYANCSINMSGIRNQNLNHPVTYLKYGILFEYSVSEKKKTANRMKRRTVN